MTLECCAVALYLSGNKSEMCCLPFKLYMLNSMYVIHILYYIYTIQVYNTLLHVHAPLISHSRPSPLEWNVVNVDIVLCISSASSKPPSHLHECYVLRALLVLFCECVYVCFVWLTHPRPPSVLMRNRGDLAALVWYACRIFTGTGRHSACVTVRDYMEPGRTAAVAHGPNVSWINVARGCFVGECV